MDETALTEALRRAMPEKENEMLSIAARQWLAEGEAKGKTEGLLWNPGIDVDVRENAERVRFLVFDPETHALGTVTIPVKKAK